MEYRGRVVVVTGASSGIGQATARAFARRGSTVMAVARRERRLASLAEACREDAPASGYLAGDLGDRGFAERVVEETLARHGRIDVLVNNAAMSKHKRVYGLSADEAERVMAVNFLSCVWTTLAALPDMLCRGEGAIVNVSSFAARVVPPREAIYAASKAAMSAFTEGLWLDLAGSGVFATLVVPGAIDTEIWDTWDEPGGYEGRRAPPQIVVDAIFEALEKRRHEIVVPKRSAGLAAASFLRLAAPGLLRRSLARIDPVSEDSIARARRSARRAPRS
jgi:short-subunit dehydrogenase